jgi:hypothetical protein
VLVILVVCALPVVAAWLAYFVWPPAARSNYGHLIPAHLLSDPPLAAADGGMMRLSTLRGRWVLVQIDRSGCDPQCRKKLTYIRQLRLTQGKDSDRIERVWLVMDDGPLDPVLLHDFAGTRVLRAAGSPLLSEFPDAGDPRDHIFLVDPIGNLMLRYPRDPDPNGMKRDLSRLLSVSRIG